MIIKADHDIILVLFYWIIRHDYTNKYLVTGDWSQSSSKAVVLVLIALYGVMCSLRVFCPVCLSFLSWWVLSGIVVHSLGRGLRNRLLCFSLVCTSCAYVVVYLIFLLV